jgi:hypothetical protein
MEGTTPLLHGSGLAEFEHGHPEFAISRVEGIVRAWKPVPGDPFSGEMTYGRTEAELLAKLTAALGG